MRESGNIFIYILRDVNSDVLGKMETVSCIMVVEPRFS